MLLIYSAKSIGLIVQQIDCITVTVRQMDRKLRWVCPWA